MPTKIRIAAVAATLAATAVGLTACDSGISHGEITAKRYIPASSHIEMQPIYTTQCMPETTVVGGRVTTTEDCSRIATSWVPITVNDPECYRLSLRAGKNTGQVCVSPTDYASSRVGGTW